jgi:molybdate transport system substrate-binding protein
LRFWKGLLMKRIAAVVLICAAGAASAAEITVSAAASLNNAFREAAAVFEAAHPGDRVLLNFAASDALAAQIAKGAPADVFASADQESMDRARPHLAPGSRRDFASNRLVVAVPFGSKLDLRTLADLRQPAVQRLTTGNPASVPVGRYTKGALEKVALWGELEPKFVFGTNVRQSLDYIARGEVEAGLVYQTDVASQAEKVRTAMVVPTTTPITYPLALIKKGPNPAGGRAFVEFILSPGGQSILARFGFGKP